MVECITMRWRAEKSRSTLVQVRRPVLVIILALAFGAARPVSASAVVPLGPGPNASTSSTPTFSWQLERGETAWTLELSPNPAPGENGGFTDDIAKRMVLLAETQTSYAVGTRDPLSAGDWYWHVSAFGPLLDFRWSPTNRIHVPDEPIRLRSFHLTVLQCIRQLTVDFAYSDNSAGQPATYRLEFRRSRRGRLVTSVGGRAEGGHVFRAFGIPRRLRRGRYYARLRLRDAGKHVARSRFRRVRIGRC